MATRRSNPAGLRNKGLANNPFASWPEPLRQAARLVYSTSFQVQLACPASVQYRLWFMPAGSAVSLV